MYINQDTTIEISESEIVIPKLEHRFVIKGSDDEYNRLKCECGTIDENSRVSIKNNDIISIYNYTIAVGEVLSGTFTETESRSVRVISKDEKILKVQSYEYSEYNKYTLFTVTGIF